MIIIKIKSKKQLREAPLLDLIDASDSRSRIIGKAGMASDPEGFVEVSKGLYKNTKQNLVIILPSAKLLTDIKSVLSRYDLQGTFRTPSELQDLLTMTNKDLEWNDLHILIPTSWSLKGDYADPSWFVHDLIGHYLENKSNKFDSRDYIPRKNKLEELTGEDLSKVGEALYAGVSESHRPTAGKNLKKIKPEQIAKLRLDDLFNVAGPLKDDRWPDILAAIALEEYDENKVSSYLEEQGREDLKDALMKKVQTLIEKVKTETLWLPGFTTFIRSW